MALIINHNLMAMTAARNLNTVYNRLSTSTQRLSSGLRINSAADDAAGLAIRELMRADIAVLNQGLRNASDGVSMIQTAEGALSVIDEKLIRMKELAEQAATGTYTTVQRDIMNSEYQAMAAEIDRIANATDFNGIKLLDGSVSSQHDGRGVKIHFGAGNDADEDYYFINMGDARATEVTGLQIGGDAKNDVWGTAGTSEGAAGGCCGGGVTSLTAALGQSGKALAFGYNHDLSETTDASLVNPSYLHGMFVIESATSLQNLIDDVNKGSQARIKVDFGTTSAGTFASGMTVCIGDEAYLLGAAGSAEGKTNYAFDTTYTSASMAFAATVNQSSQSFWAYLSGGAVFIFAKDGGAGSNGLYGCDVGSGVSAAVIENLITWTNMETGTEDSAGSTFAMGGYKWATATAKLTAGGSYGMVLNGLNVGAERDIWVANVGSAGSTADIGLIGSTVENLTGGFNHNAFSEIQNAADGEWAGAEIRTQSSAQEALDALYDAILKKDKIRADLGALQNRLENTMTNVSVQAEMLQAAESRISDVDVALEMTEFTKNNILAQAATSMLAQANSLAQLALSLLG
jgi:flagellin